MQEFPTTQPRIIGLTGGIGSGKSTVLRAFNALGIPGWSADEAGRELYRKDEQLRKWVAELWGTQLLVLNKEGQDIDINRSQLAQIAFNDPAALQALSAQVHPRIALAFDAWFKIQSQRMVPPPFVIREAAILFESGTDAHCDWTVTVEAPEEERIKRVMNRDRVTEADVKARMSRQWSAPARIERADFVVQNSENEHLLTQVMTLEKRWSVGEL
jgi:dephospho-CoA kinase